MCDLDSSILKYKLGKLKSLTQSNCADLFLDWSIILFCKCFKMCLIMIYAHQAVTLFIPLGSIDLSSITGLYQCQLQSNV